jgi:hypothetical protein
MTYAKKEDASRKIQTAQHVASALEATDTADFKH